MTFRWMEKVALSELSDGGQFESWEGLNTTYKTASMPPSAILADCFYDFNSLQISLLMHLSAVQILMKMAATLQTNKTRTVM